MWAFFFMCSCIALALAAVEITKIRATTEIEIKTKIEQRVAEKLHENISKELSTILVNHKNWVMQQQKATEEQLLKTAKHMELFEEFAKEAKETISAYKMFSRVK